MKYKFEDIAINSTAKKLPEPSDNEHYIGLEHLDSGNLYVTRWGADTAPIGEKLLMKKGDVLFGKRRAYQKKVGIAPFDGIFSAHGMVFRPKEDVICKEFFPFFISSDYFLNEAIRISVGGLSPTINWKDLRVLEFELPSLEEQRVLADKLWAAYEVKESYKNLLAQTDKLLHAQFQKMFGDPRKNDKQWDIKKMGEVFTIERGGSPRPITEYLTDAPEGLNWIKIGDAGEGEKYITSTKEKIKPEGLKKTRLVHKGDFLLSNSMSFGRPYILDIDGCIHDGWLVLHDNYQTFDKSYLYYFLSTPELYEQFKTLAAGGVVNNLNSDIVKKVEIIIPPLEMQLEFVSIAEQAERTKASLNKGIEAIEAVIRSLIAEGTTKV